jgi:hypothetical protein
MGVYSRDLGHGKTPAAGLQPRNGFYREIKESVETAWQKLMGREGLVQTGSLDGLHEGAAYDFRSATGDNFSGAVQYFDPPTDFVATVEKLNHAVLRVKVEQYGGQRTASIWLSAYGLPAAQVTDFETRANALLQKAFTQYQR